MNKLILQSLLLSIISTSSSMENNQNPDNRDPLINNQLTDQRLEVNSNVQLSNLSKQEINLTKANNKLNNMTNEFKKSIDQFNAWKREYQIKKVKFKKIINNLRQEIGIINEQLKDPMPSDTKRPEQANKFNEANSKLKNMTNELQQEKKRLKQGEDKLKQFMDQFDKWHYEYYKQKDKSYTDYESLQKGINQWLREAKTLNEQLKKSIISSIPKRERKTKTVNR